MLTTTLNKILKAGPCRSGWRQLTGQSSNKDTWIGNDDVLTILDILKSNDIYDAMWAVMYTCDITLYNEWCCHLVKKYHGETIVLGEYDSMSTGATYVYHVNFDTGHEQDYYIKLVDMHQEFISFIGGDSNVNDNAK